MASLNPAVVEWRNNANAWWPNRKKASDGTWGDKAHQARKSDHNTGDAIDITHDPASGAHGDEIAARAMKDPRIKYIIWNHRIWSRDRASEGWRAYKGKNPHTKHVHLSFKRGGSCSNCASPKGVPAKPKPAARGDVSPTSKKKAAPKKAAPKKTAPKKAKSTSGNWIQRLFSRRPRTVATRAAAKKQQAGKKIVQGEHSVVLGSTQRMAAHVKTPHTGGGKIAKGSPTVFVGPKQLAFARIADPTTDGGAVVSGKETVLIG